MTRASNTCFAAVGGIVGTGLMLQGMKHADKFPKPLQPPELKRDPGDYVAERVENFIGKGLTHRWHERLAESSHWAYGVTWPALYGALMPELQINNTRDAAVKGAIFGTAVWALGHIVLLPMNQIEEPVHRQGGTHVASALLSHVVYGMVVSVGAFVLEGLWERRQ